MDWCWHICDLQTVPYVVEDDNQKVPDEIESWPVGVLATMRDCWNS